MSAFEYPHPLGARAVILSIREILERLDAGHLTEDAAVERMHEAIRTECPSLVDDNLYYEPL